MNERVGQHPNRTALFLWIALDKIQMRRARLMTRKKEGGA